MLHVAYRLGPLAFAPHAIGASSGRAVIPPRSSIDAVLKALRGEPGPLGDAGDLQDLSTLFENQLL